MREIEFRGKTVDNEWIYGNLIQNEDAQTSYIIEKQDIDLTKSIYNVNIRRYGKFTSCAYPIDFKTIGQYIGKTDKNGKKIYDGDIIKARHNEDLYIVKYEDCSFVIEDKWGGRINQDQDSIYRLECEIVGNKFDNPELLGE